MVRLRITADTLRQIAQSAAREHYLPTSTDLAMMKRLHLEGALKERREGSRFRPIVGITNLRVKMEPQGREAESRRRAHGT